MEERKNMKFKLPTKSDLKSRTSTINNAFAISITPYMYPSQIEVVHFLEELNIKEGQCAYCLGESNAMDHVKPLVTNGLPTGYITEIRNLVPCCSACNSAKGAKDFLVWYKSQKNVERLYKKGLTNEQLDNRYNIVSAYIDKIPQPINYKEILGDEVWAEYIARKAKMLELLKEDQKFCNQLSAIIAQKIKKEQK